jgi:hypothetical protein
MDQNGGERDVKDEGRGRPQFLRGRLGFSGDSSILLNSDLFGPGGISPSAEYASSWLPMHCRFRHAAARLGPEVHNWSGVPAPSLLSGSTSSTNVSSETVAERTKPIGRKRVCRSVASSVSPRRFRMENYTHGASAGRNGTGWANPLAFAFPVPPFVITSILRCWCWLERPEE